MVCGPPNISSILSGSPAGENYFHNNIKMLITFYSVDICNYAHTRAMTVKQLVPQHESRHQELLAVIIFDEVVAVKTLIQLNLNHEYIAFQ